MKLNRASVRKPIYFSEALYLVGELNMDPARYSMRLLNFTQIKSEEVELATFSDLLLTEGVSRDFLVLRPTLLNMGAIDFPMPFPWA